MGILHTLSEIAKNNDKFKNYEQNQRDNDLQREELNRRREHKQQEIKAAQDLGKTIIDVVDIMDQHSEDIAENVETVTEPVIGLAPAITGLLGLGGAYKGLIRPAMDKESELSDAFRENKEVNELVEKIREADKKINYEEKWGISSWDLQSKESVAKIKKRHPELGQKAEELYKKHKNELQKQYKKVKIGVAIPIASAIVGFVAANVYATKLQVESSRVARWQARKVLEDPKYFVNYTPEQIEEARKNLENNPEYKKKDKKLKTDMLKSGLFKGLVSVIKDNRAYRKWKKTDVDESKKVDRQLTPQELENAKKDKEVIQRVVRTVNNQAEIYSQNMEVAANVILGSTPFLGAAVGAVVSSIMNWTKVIPNFVNKQVQKYGSDSAKSAYDELKGLKEGTREYKVARKKFLKEWHFEPISKMANEEAKRPSRMQIIEKNIRKYTASALTTKWGRRGVFGLIGGFVTSIAGSLIALKLQKASSRTGRYIAKRELEENPKNFIGYTDEEMQEVKDVKAPKKSFGEKVKEYALFIPNVMKNYFEYQKYKKTELKQNKMLQEELTKLDVTETQMKEAKNLQRKIFNTFEKVDDKSQEYSESMEAAVEIAQPFVYGAGMLTMISPLLYGGYLAVKGKLSAKSVINKVLTTLSGSSKITEKKWFKKYLENIAKQLPDKVAQATPNSQIWGKVFADINLEKTPIVEIIGKFTKNSVEYIKNFSNLSLAEKRAVVEDLSRIAPENSSFAKRLSSLKYAGDNEFKAVMDALFNPSELGKSIQKMNEDEYMHFRWKITDLLGGKREWIGNVYSPKTNLADALFEMPRQELGQFLESLSSKDSITKLSKMPDSEFINNKQTVKSLIKACEEKIKYIDDNINLDNMYNHSYTPEQIFEKQRRKAVFEQLKSIFGLFDNLNKQDYSIVSKILTEKTEFFKNISKMDNADFERIKGHIKALIDPSDEFMSKITKENVQKYADEIFANAEKFKNAVNIQDDAVVPVIKKILSEISGSDEFLKMSKEDLYKFIDTQILAPYAQDFENNGALGNMAKSALDKAHDILSHPEKPLPDVKKLRFADVIPTPDPIKEIEKLEAKITAKTDEEFSKIMQKLANNNRILDRVKVADMDKAYVLDSLGKLKEVIKRLPKDEMKKIVSAMINEFSEHPDQFIAYVQSGKILRFYQTEGFKKAVIAAGVSWTAVNLALIYTIESILADLKLKSGRLGVMKALDSLQDPAYYANIEPETVPAAQPANQPVNNPINLLDMLKK